MAVIWRHLVPHAIHVHEYVTIDVHALKIKSYKQLSFFALFNVSYFACIHIFHYNAKNFSTSPQEGGFLMDIKTSDANNKLSTVLNSNYFIFNVVPCANWAHYQIINVGIFCHEYIHHFTYFLLFEKYQKYFLQTLSCCDRESQVHSLSPLLLYSYAREHACSIEMEKVSETVSLSSFHQIHRKGPWL